MADDLRASLESAFAADAAGTLDTTPAPAADAPLPDASPPAASPAAPPPAPDSTDRPRNPDGTFKAKEGDPAPVAVDPQAAAKTAAAASATPATGTPTADRIAPPENWKGAAKIRWEKLPRDIQQEIVAELGRVGQSETQFGAYRQILDPVRVQYTAEYGSVENGLKQLIALEQAARKDPQGFLNWFAQSRGISLAAPAPQVQQPNIDPALTPVLQPLQQQLNEVTQKLSDYERQQQQQAYNATLQTVGQFMNDRAHPYAAQVAPEMERLINTGAVTRDAAGLQKAYEIATWADPTIRAELIQLEREARQKEDQQRVEAARRAGASLNGSPIPGANPNAANPPGTVRDELMRAWNASTGAI